MAGIALAQLRQQSKPSRSGSLQIQQDEREVGMLLHEVHALTAVCRLEHDGVASKLLENAAQGLADQRMVIDQQEFHAGLLRAAG